MRLLVFLFMAVACLAADPPSGPLRERIDVNNAPQETIEKLPGVGPKLAQQIMAGRPYKTIDDLDQVKGIGPKKVALIRPHVFVVPMRGAAIPKPSAAVTNQAKININSASQKELESLPGIGPKKAEAIISKRPFHKPEDLMKIPGFKQAQYDKLKDQISVR